MASIYDVAGQTDSAKYNQAAITGFGAQQGISAGSPAIMRDDTAKSKNVFVSQTRQKYDPNAYGVYDLTTEVGDRLGSALVHAFGGQTDSDKVFEASKIKQYTDEGMTPVKRVIGGEEKWVDDKSGKVLFGEYDDSKTTFQDLIPANKHSIIGQQLFDAGLSYQLTYLRSHGDKSLATADALESLSYRPKKPVDPEKDVVQVRNGLWSRSKEDWVQKPTVVKKYGPWQREVDKDGKVQLYRFELDDVGNQVGIDTTPLGIDTKDETPTQDWTTFKAEDGTYKFNKKTGAATKITDAKPTPGSKEAKAVEEATSTKTQIIETSQNRRRLIASIYNDENFNLAVGPVEGQTGEDQSWLSSLAHGVHAFGRWDELSDLQNRYKQLYGYDVKQAMQIQGRSFSDADLKAAVDFSTINPTMSENASRKSLTAAAFVDAVSEYEVDPNKFVTEHGYRPLHNTLSASSNSFKIEYVGEDGKKYIQPVNGGTIADYDKVIQGQGTYVSPEKKTETAGYSDNVNKVANQFGF